MLKFGLFLMTVFMLVLWVLAALLGPLHRLKVVLHGRGMVDTNLLVSG